MFSRSALLATLTLALAVVANPIIQVRNLPVTLPIVRRVNSTGVARLVAHDQQRAQALKARGAAKVSSEELFVADAASSGSVTATNQIFDYVVNVAVGSSATTYSLLVDTGSSNTWVGAGTKYVKSSSSTATKDKVTVTYGSGQFSGTEYTDTVAFGNGLTITKQSIGVASSSQGFDGVDGILGIGPVDLTKGTLNPDKSSTIPTVTDNLYSQSFISQNLVSVSFNTPSSDSDANGELTFGGTDSSKYTGSINYVSITSTSPASEYWGIDQSVAYGSTTILSSTAGIVDTGTTLVLLATDAYKKYVKATGATLDKTTGLLRVTTAQYAKLQSLYFTVGGVEYELTANAQSFPRSLNSAIGGSSSYVYLVVNDLGSNSGEGLDFIDGLTFLERFYSVFDTGNKRVGLATTPNTDAVFN